MNPIKWMAVPLAAALAVGCASTPEEDSPYAKAREQYQQLAANEQIQALAPTPLYDAQQALQRAEDADDAVARRHQIYLANQQMAVARAVAERKQLETQMEALAEEREQLRLSLREKELQQAQSRTQELQQELAALEAERTDRGLMVTLDNVFFETDQANLKPGVTGSLDKLAGFMRDHPEQQVVVEGHTDSRGPESYNDQLSRQRAEAVKQAMVTRGVEPDRIQARGYGESRPVASNENPGGRQLNRRVEIVFPDI